MENTISAKLIKKIFIRGIIETKTGLSIGGSSVGLEIGGADKVVVRNPIDNKPYIPGSSLKGKIRSLLEKEEGIMTYKVKFKEGEENTYYKKEKIPNKEIEKIETGPCGCGECLICQIFGAPAERKQSPSRLIVRDSELIGIVEEGELLISEEGVKKLKESAFTDMPYTEVKTEVVIDRITASATPRNFERVPAGTIFSLELICDIYEGDDEGKILNEVFKGLILLQDDYLGGSGTRGYGKVKIKIDNIGYKDKKIYEEKGSFSPYPVEIPEELKSRE